MILYMPCYHPIRMYRSRAGRNKETGKWPLVTSISQGYADMPVDVPCGRCIGCRLEYSRQWAVRAIHEAKLHDANSFITLTYAPEYLPADVSIHVDEMQRFLKRLRKAVDPVKIRFMCAGEYGSRYKRPHYHLLIFGYDFPDKYVYKLVHGYKYYRSPLLEKVWPYGISCIGDVTFESAAYVARYILKKIKGEDEELKESIYQGRSPEFMTMSRKPGIAADWIAKHINDVYSVDSVIVRNDIRCKPPRFYDHYLEFVDPERFHRVRYAREKLAKEHDSDCERLLREEYVKSKKLEKLIRRYHADLDSIE